MLARGMTWQHGKPCRWWHAPTGTPRGAGRAGRVADRPVGLTTPGNAGRGKGPDFERMTGRGEGMTTGGRLTGSERVRHVQTVLYAKAKEEPERRFHALCDKVWREDFLREAWAMVRRNGGQPGEDGESLEAIERLHTSYVLSYYLHAQPAVGTTDRRPAMRHHGGLVAAPSGRLIPNWNGSTGCRDTGRPPRRLDGLMHRGGPAAGGGPPRGPSPVRTYDLACEILWCTCPSPPL